MKNKEYLWNGRPERYLVVNYHPCSPDHLERWLNDMFKHGWCLITSYDSYFIFETKSKKETACSYPIPGELNV